MLEKIKKHKKLTIALVIVLIVAILIGVVVHNVKKTGSDMMDMSMGVQAFHLEQQDMSSTVSTSGTVESANVVEVTTEVTSPIKELNVALGDHVEKGQVLCTFDGEEIRQQIADLESQNAAVKKADQSSKQKAQRALEQAQAQANAKAAENGGGDGLMPPEAMAQILDSLTIRNMINFGGPEAEANLLPMLDALKKAVE